MTTSEKLTVVSENIPKVFSAGEDAARKNFWDKYQQNGNRSGYAGAFSGAGWTNEMFKPEYNIICSGNCNYMFYHMEFDGDLGKTLKDSGITLDLSGATSMHGLFNGSAKITRVGEIDIRNAGAATSSIFAYCAQLKRIDKLIVDANNAYASAFVNCFNLRRLFVEGEIASSMNLQWSPYLYAESFVSIVEALSDSTEGLSVTFSESALNNADWSTTEYASWDELVATKQNWTFTLV